VLEDDAYIIAVLRMPWGNHGSGTVHSHAGAVAVSLAGASRCEVMKDRNGEPKRGE
jgi:hypothetical protein